jgi:hypothetical protein
VQIVTAAAAPGATENLGPWLASVCNSQFAIVNLQCSVRDSPAYASLSPCLLVPLSPCLLSSRLLPHRLEHPVLIRELPGLELRVDQIAVDLDLKRPATGGDELEFLDLILEVGEQLGRQTDGLGLVVSHVAVGELNSHG